MHRVITPECIPIKENEKWFIVDPNNRNQEFVIPHGAYALCILSFEDFLKAENYKITDNDRDNGWITLLCGEDAIKMPYYVFARYFDAKAFIKHGSSKTKKKTPERFYG